MSKDVQNNPKSSGEAQNKTVPVAHTVELKFGYQDKEESELVHKSVTFGKRSTGADVIRSADHSGGSDVQYVLEMASLAISQFGTLPMPVPLTVLLSLDEIDRDLLVNAYFEFIENTAPDGAQKIELGKAQLAVGFERDGVKYNAVEFGRRLTGYDDIAIEREAEGSEAVQTVLKRCRRIAKITSADGSKNADGGMTLAEMEALDYQDFITLKNVGDEWLNSFRR